MSCELRKNRMEPNPKRLSKAQNISMEEVEHAALSFNTRASCERGDYLCFQPRKGQDARDHSRMKLPHFMRESSKIRWPLRKQILIDSGNW